MSLTESMSLVRYWERHPQALYGAGALPIGDGGGGGAAEKFNTKYGKHYTTKDEVNEMIRMWGPPQDA